MNITSKSAELVAFFAGAAIVFGGAVANAGDSHVPPASQWYRETHELFQAYGTADNPVTASMIGYDNACWKEAEKVTLRVNGPIDTEILSALTFSKLSDEQKEQTPPELAQKYSTTVEMLKRRFPVCERPGDRTQLTLAPFTAVAPSGAVTFYYGSQPHQ